MSLRFQPFLWWFILVFQFISNCNFAKSSNSSRFLYGCSYGSQVSNTTEINRLRDLTKGMGATATGCQCSWSDIQASSNSSYNFTKCDTQFELQTNAGFECFSYSGFTPDWALNASILAKYGSGIGYRFPPANKWIAQFEAAYTAIAQRYDNIIKYWEFGNEPNGCGWIEDNCANSDEYTTYVPWLQRWYNSMKKGSNNTVLSIGGLDYNNNGGNNANNASKYLIGIYENGGGNYFDAVAIHPYAQQEIYWTGLQDTYNGTYILCMIHLFAMLPLYLACAHATSIAKITLFCSALFVYNENY